MFEALAYIVYIRVRYHFSLESTTKMGIKNFEVKVELQKWTLQFREKNSNKCVSFIQFMLSFIIATW